VTVLAISCKYIRTVSLIHAVPVLPQMSRTQCGRQ